MSNEKMQKYKDLYSQYIDYAVKLHNYHQVFMNHIGLESGKAVRTSLRNMARLERELQKASLEAYKEHRQNVKDQASQRRAERAWRKANPKKMGRPKKDVKNDNNKSTTGTI